MFDVISTAQNTQWLSFPTLCTKYTYSHVANEAVDFQVVPGNNYFAEFNKKFGFEVLRTTNKNNQDVIQRAKKRQFDDLSCGAISKLCGSEIAIGMTTGFIKIFNTQTGDYMPYKFKPDRVGNSVIGLDYSNNDEYLAAVYDSSDINLFGMKTSIKTDTFRFDGISTLVRFHPVRKFALAIGAYEGGITMLDIQTKKRLFSDQSAHEAPIRDICMFESSQDVFVSCSLDCNIKVFDLRRRAMIHKYRQTHPMSTVCVSPCGTFCVAGNLKGEVISYDFRTMKEPLDTKRVHESSVVRVAFIPSVLSPSNLTLDYGANSTCSDTTGTFHKSASSSSQPSPLQSDSFAKFVDVCHHMNGAVAGDATPKNHRDSWADLMQVRKVHDFSMDSVAETPSRMSTGTDLRSELRLKRKSRLSVDNSILSNISTDVEFKITDFDAAENETPKVPRNRVVEPFGDLQHIQEEVSLTDGKINKSVQNVAKKTLIENKNINNMVHERNRRSTFHDQFSMNIKGGNTSSPTNLPHKNEAITILRRDTDVKQNKAKDSMQLTQVVGEKAELPQKKWLHTVDHKEFADAFAAKVKEMYHDENPTANREDDKENVQNNQQIRPSKPLNVIERLVTFGQNPGGQTDEMVLVNKNELNDVLSDILDEQMSLRNAELQHHIQYWLDSVMACTNILMQDTNL